MKALTIWPEWAYAITHLGKRVENRSWAPPASLIGQRIAIHAGKNVGGKPTSYARRCGVDSVQHMAGERTGMAHGTWILGCTKSAVVATAILVGFDREQRTKWDVPGEVHWRLDAVEVFVWPAACGGKQGLWDWTP